jgi:GNAT superfamily N-acetyltransferase
MEGRFNPRTNPFYEHAEVQLFNAFRDNDVVGRIAGIINYKHNEHANEKTVFFGFFESIDDRSVSGALLDAVQEWGAEKGMSFLRGPAQFSSNEEWGFLVDGFDSSPMVHMPYNPIYYTGLMDGAGMKKEKDVVAYHLDVVKEIPKRIREPADKVMSRYDAKVRPIDMSRYDAEMRQIMEIYNSAWTGNWGFVPMTEKEIEHFAKEMHPFVIPGLICILEVGGKMAGFAMAVPDLSQAFKHLRDGHLFPDGFFKLIYYSRKITAVRCVKLGVLQEYRAKGLDSLLYLHLWEAAKKEGYIDAELSWIHEDNTPLRNIIESLGGKTYKRYRIYGRAIPVKQE